MKITTRPFFIWFVIVLNTIRMTHCYNYSIRIGSIFHDYDSGLSSSLQKAVSVINNSSSVLPDTRLDLHTLFIDGDFVSSQQAVCSQLQHSVLAIFSSLSGGVVREVTNTWHVPHFSSSLVTRLEADQHPYNIHLGPHLDSLTLAVETGLRAVLRPAERLAVITHHTGQLRVSQLVSSLQSSGHSVLLELLQTQDIRAELGAVRRHKIRTVVVDVSSPLILPFLQQALQVALLQPNTKLLFTSLDFPAMSHLEHVLMTEVTLISYSLSEAPGQREDHREFILRESLELLVSTISNMSELPVTERLNCSDSEKVNSEGERLLQEVRPHRAADLHLMVRRAGTERRLGVFNGTSRTLRLLENLTVVQEEVEDTEDSLNLHVTGECEARSVLRILKNLPKVTFRLNEGSRGRSLQSLLKRCDVVVCNSSSLLSIVNTDGLDFSPIFTNISSPAESVPDSVSHLNYLLGFLVSFILTVVFLTLVSHTKPNLDSRFCVLDSTWVVATASLLNIQHARLHSASIRVLVLGWSLFSTSYFFCYLRHSLTETRQSGQSSLYILGNRDCPQVNRIVGTLNAANISGEYTEQKDHLSDLPIVPYIGLGVVMLVCLLASCLEMLVKTCERRGGRDGGSQSSQEERGGSEQELLNWQDKPGQGHGQSA